MISLSRQVPVALLGAALATLACASAPAEQPTEYEVKAAFVHNIVKFVEWPETARTDGSLTLCILGKDPSGSALDALRGRHIGNKVWEVSHANPDTNLGRCDVLFIAASESGNLGQILAATKGSAVLTMGDSPGYAQEGVMVNLYLEQNRVRFEINTESVKRARLKISSQLLKLARIIAEPGGVK